MLKFLRINNIIGKYRNFKINMTGISNEKYQIFLAKRDYVNSKFQKFFLDKLGMKYLFAFFYHTEKHWKPLGLWTSNILLNGLLIYVAVTGYINPLFTLHRIIAYGLTLYIPEMLIRHAYNKVCYERRVLQKPGMYPQQVQQEIAQNDYRR